jgi:hypothetical protein
MIILTHVLIALSSVLFTALSFFNPSKAKLRTTYVLIASTLISGTYLVVSAQASLLRTCVSGLLFVTITSIVTHFSRVRLSNLSAVKLANK